MSQKASVLADGVPVTAADILGCWKLERALEARDGVVGPGSTYGEGAAGFLHYLAGGRVAVMIAFGDRKPVQSRDRRGATIAELAESARTFDAYAGRFSLIGPDRIAHHIEISSHQNHVGTDLVRRIEREGDLLRLYPPAFDEGGVRVQRWLEWRRLGAPRSAEEEESIDDE